MVLCIFVLQAGTEKAGQGHPCSCPICCQMGWPGKPSGRHSLLSKNVGTVLLAQIRTGLNPENHKMVLYVLVNIFNRKSWFFLEEITKSLMKLILTSQSFYSLLFWISQCLLRHITCVQEVIARGDARDMIAFSQSKTVTHSSVL